MRRFLFMAALVFIPVLTFAQVSGDFGAAIDDPVVILKALVTAVATHNWPLLGVLAIIAVTFVVRRFGASKIPWLKTDDGGTLLNAMTAVALGLAAAAFSGGAIPITWGLIGTSLMAGAAAAGGRAYVRRIMRALRSPAVALIGRIPQVGRYLVFAYDWLCGFDVEKNVIAEAERKYQPLDPSKTPGSAVASGLDQP
jgi:hypothetical protein